MDGFGGAKNRGKANLLRLLCPRIQISCQNTRMDLLEVSSYFTPAILFTVSGLT
jgi:hypothetical protein